MGTAIALPALEAMVAPAKAVAAAAGGAAAAAPKRMAFVYIPNGVIMENWTPRQVGANYALSPTLQPLKPFQNDFTLISGFAHDKARANGDGPGDHARANATFLTGVQARKTAGADIRLGVSVDQVAAQKLGRATRFPSLELSCDRGRNAGSCDSGYSCAYQFNLAWKSETTPMSPEVDPRLVFERLFGGGGAAETKESRERRQRYNQSILDFVLEDANRLKGKLGTTDQRKLDEYLTAVRELEMRIQQAERVVDDLPAYAKPVGIPQENADHIRIMFDMMTLAFQTDTTRVATFLIAHDGSNRPYKGLGVTDGHHQLSHHQGDKDKIAKIAKIDYYHMQQFAYFLDKLRTTKDVDGKSLLDNSMILLGGGISDGNRHWHHDLPVIVAGRAGGTFRQGRHIRVEKTPLSNLFLTMLDQMDVRIPRFGDSTGRFNGLYA
ncbi:MAG: DUF1552 domain-containing protein [Verrucomicrobiota bacterium]